MKPLIPASGQQLYDELMANIEQELTTDRYSLLAEKYKDETTDQAMARASQYSRAFAEYDKAYEAYMRSATEQMNKYKKNAFHSLEQEDRKKDQTMLNAFSSALVTLPAS